MALTLLAATLDWLTSGPLGSYSYGDHANNATCMPPPPSPGIPASPGNPTPVPGVEPTQLPPGIGRTENRPTFGLPDVPGLAPANVPPSIWQAEWMNPWTVVAIGVGVATVAIAYVVVKGYAAGSGNVNVRPTDGAPGGCYECGVGGVGMAPGFSGGEGELVK